MENLTQTLDHILKQAQSAGAQAAEALLQTGQNLSFKAEQGELGEYKVSSSHVVGVRLFKDQKVAISYSEDLSPESLKAMVEKAISSLPYMPHNPHETLAGKEVLESTQNSPEPKALSPEELKARIDFTLKLESDTLKADSRVKGAPYNGLQEVTSVRAMKNTLGAFSFERLGFVSCYTSALMSESDKQAMFYYSNQARTLDQLNPQVCIDKSVHTAADLLQGKSIKGGRYSVVFTTDLLSNLFSTFSLPFSAKAMVEGTNPFKDKLGKVIATSKLTLSDDPRISTALYPSLFDDEGFATNETFLIKDGIFHGLLHNSATAKELGLPHTANASRGPRSPLATGSVHKKIALGDATQKDLFSGEVFEIIDLQGLHSGANPTTGDFSFAASGHFWRGGERVQVVRGVTVSGNFYEALKDISMIGEKQQTNSSMYFTAPLIRFEGLTTAGEA